MPCGLLKTEADTCYIAATFIAEEEPGGEGRAAADRAAANRAADPTLTLTVGENGSVASVTQGYAQRAGPAWQRAATPIPYPPAAT